MHAFVYESEDSQCLPMSPEDVHCTKSALICITSHLSLRHPARLASKNSKHSNVIGGVVGQVMESVSYAYRAGSFASILQRTQFVIWNTKSQKMK